MSAADVNYRFSGAIRNKKGVLTHVQIEDQQIYPVADIVNWIRDGTYSFYTIKVNGNRTQVKVRGKRFMTTDGNYTKYDNLDELPVPALI
jgi:hypothetical protein